ncbi:MAG TPA: hypothetical protein VEJ89_06785 [Myxococcaceae bacterium]|jgi:hypothetical protein|nr:hypothetical protein [Myxococcaceae bacterium]
MAASLSMPADPTPVSLVWRAVSSLRFLSRLLGIPEQKAALASAARNADTSLTQAELEVLK